MLEKEAVIILDERIPEYTEDSDLFGVEKGALFLARSGMWMKYAVGDFDSVSEDSVKLIRESCEEMIRLNPIKDDSDSEAAVIFALKKGYKKIRMSGTFAGRADHTYVNLFLTYRYPGILTVEDAQNRVYSLTEGIYEMKPDGFPYISFFAPEKADISLKGFFYELERCTISTEDLFTLSNEITENPACLTVHAGKVIVIQSSDQ
ncbi:MAG: thiamine diphosphokinase [Solobacterium sp.]|nr:thiamine diphosphokinase [Solobacterium sp.]